MTTRRGPEAALLALAALLVVALALRLYGIDWDQARFFHPDERFILLFKLPELKLPDSPQQFLDPVLSPWNPKAFAYGSLPLYLMKGVSALAQQLVPEFTIDASRFTSRGLSASADVATVGLVFLLGQRLYGRGTGLLAAALTTFAVQHIQLSHFATVDVLLTTFVLLALWGCARAMARPDLPAGLIIGLGLGLGLATKVSMLPLLLPIAAAYTLAVVQGERSGAAARLRRAAGSAALAGGVAAAAFLVGNPYALLDFQTFLEDTREQSQMVLRMADLPYTRQYLGTIPYWYLVEQLTLWGLGLPLGVVAWLGFAFALFRGLVRREAAAVLLIAWAVPYFALTGGFPVKFLRYMLPMTPVLLLMGARLLTAWGEAAGRVGAPGGLARQAPRVVTAAVLLATAFYALAFLNIYSAEHPGVRMARWIGEHVPAGRAILREHWEEGIPFLEPYRVTELPMYDPDNAGKLDLLAQRLAESDYVVFYSNRLYGTVGRLRERYPLSAEYYRALFAGDLGYELAFSTGAAPSLLGVTWIEDTLTRPGLVPPAGLAPPPGLAIQSAYADESFTAYDHPLTLLFENRRRLNAAQIKALLQPALAPAATGRAGAMLDDDLRAAQAQGGTWSQIFDRASPANQFPLLTWVAALEVMAASAFLLLFRLFPGLPDRGWLLAKTLGLLLVTYAVWLAASLEALPATPAAISLAAAALVLAGGISYLANRAGVHRALAGRRGRLLLGEVVFLGALVGFYLLRLQNPDLWHPARGGEKPMDFAYLNAVIKSTYMPPFDPWFAGGSLNYYYFGQMLVATLTKLTGIVPAVAYNLAVPTLFALFAANAFTAATALVAAARTRVAAPPALRLTDPVPPPAGSTPAAPVSGVARTGLLAVFFIAVAGNLDGAVQVLDAFRKVGPGGVAAGLPGVAGAVQTAAGWWTVIVQRTPLPPFDYWRSRAMGSMDPTFIDPALRAPSISITEFPIFTFLFADLHAHLIALPLTVLALALAVHVATARGMQSVGGRLLGVGLLGLVVGAVRWTNTWDYPAFLALGAGAVLVGEAAAGRSPGSTLMRTGLLAAVVAGVSIVAFLPFQQHYHLFYSGGVGPSPEVTPLHLYLRMFGLFLTAIAGFVVHELWSRFAGAGTQRLAALLVRQRYRAPHALALARRLGGRARWSGLPGPAAVAVAAVAFLALTLVGFGTLGLLVLLSVAVAVLGVAELVRASGRGPAYVLVLGMVAVAAGLSGFLEVLHLDIPGEVQRMNNVFKLYLQIWTLYALAAAYAVWWVLWKGGPEGAPSQTFGLPRNAWTAALVVLGIGAAVYPALGTPVRLADRFNPLPPTIDGTAYMARAQYADEKGPIELRWDQEAIRWMQDHIPGSPVVLEAVTPLYRWGSRVSVYTGLPTVLGWDWHQSQQRWAFRDAVEARKRDVERLYAGTDVTETRNLLSRYGVSYVYVGRVERLYYPAAGIAKFEALRQSGALSVVYSNPDVTLYRVNGA